MNILFILHGNCIPTVGGIERVTDKLVNNFTSIYGHNCFLIYQDNSAGSDCPTPFKKTYFLKTINCLDLRRILSENKIDIIINQEEHYISAILSKSISDAGLNCKTIYCYHNLPLGNEKAVASYKALFSRILRDHKFSDLIKLCLYPIYRYKKLDSAKTLLNNACLLSDKTVLLSDSFKQQWLKASKIRRGSGLENKILAIPNPVSFNHSNIDLKLKEKRVLIVARLRDSQKKISTALKIWKEIEKDNSLDKWQLDIVGDGQDKTMYEDYTAKHLKRVTFYGRRDPKPFYMRSSIFMMTSDFEGWGMTVGEAIVYGCVPVAFDTYSSLHDILTDGYNGCIVPPPPKKNLTEYVTRLKTVMTDAENRNKMAQNAINSSKRFSIEAIGSMWNNLFQELVN